MTVGETLKALRSSHGITQKNLSEATGIPLQSIINYETDRREPSFKATVALERFFGITCSDLLGEPEKAITSSFAISAEERTLLCAVRQLNEEDRAMLDTFVRYLIQKGVQKPSSFMSGDKDGSA